MDCEVCGKQIFGKGLNIVIDGAKLVVCSDCAKFSTSTPQNAREEIVEEVKKAPSPPRIRPQKTVRVEVPIRDDLELVENYSFLVRKAREKMSLTHDELSRKIGAKVSTLQKLETGKMVPEQDLVKRLERALKIKLLQPSSKVVVEEKFTGKPSTLTLGDVVLTQPTKKKEDLTGEKQEREQ